MNIKNIILDLGGVIIDVNYDRAAAAFINLGFRDFSSIYNQKKQEYFFDEFEKGIISASEFRNTLRPNLPGEIQDTDIDRAWNAMLGVIPKQRALFLYELKKSYRLFLLSNTNRIHVEAFTEMIQRDYGKNILMDFFERIYLSCDVRERKPDRAIFERVIKENNLHAPETLFVDDSVQHVEGAWKAGIQSFHLDTGTTSLEKALPSLLMRLNN